MNCSMRWMRLKLRQRPKKGGFFGHKFYNENKPINSNIQVELSQIRAEIEKRIQEKEEEFENTRKAHQRVIEGIQTSLEQEANAKAELARVKKKLEADVNVNLKKIIVTYCSRITIQKDLLLGIRVSTGTR